MIATLLALLRPYWLPLAVAAALLGWVGALKVELWHAESQTEAAQAATALAVQDKQRILTAYATAAATAASAALAETSRRITDQAEAANEATRLSTRARDAAVAAAAAGAGLRDAARTVAAGCRSSPADPAVVAVSPADRLADVLGEIEGEYRAVARAADDAIIRGEFCTAAYQSLMR